MTYRIKNKEQAIKAIKDLLSDPDQVSYGNGVGMEGSLYPDVKIGLEIALKLLKEELDALPLSEVEKLRLEEITT